MKYRQFTGLLLLISSLILAPTALASTTWYVNGVSGDDNNNCMSPETACRTIGHAISLAASGDSIMVASATYGENLTIGISLNLIGSGASTTIINGGRRGTVVTVSGAAANVTLSNVTITNGLARYGGGIANSGTLRIVASAIGGNRASPPGTCIFGCNAFGGGIYNHGTLTINDSTVSGNTAYTQGQKTGATGGGIYNNGTLTINNSTVRGNSAQVAFSGSMAEAGGIGNSGTMTVNNSTLSGNTVFGLTLSAGAGITNFGSATIINSTLSGNSGAIWGGGIDNVSHAGAVNLTINNTTISGNSAGSGGSIYNQSGATPFSLQNSILAGSSRGGNCAGTVSSNGYNLSSDNTCNFNGPGDLNNTDPQLGTFGYNGGPTQTIPLLSGSPAIDAGNPSGCTDNQGNLLTTDQRGMPRPDPGDTGGCDRGAYEVQSN